MALLTLNRSAVMGWLVRSESAVQVCFTVVISSCLVICGGEEMEDLVSSPKILKLASRSDFTHI